jgi:large subunit ribosomal protein L15
MDLSKAKSLGIKRERPRRVGRGPGSGHGKTAARGMNGQKSRSGYSRKMGFEGGTMPLFRRLPRRGFNNKNFQTRFTIINVKDLSDAFESGAEVDLEKVLAVGLTSMETPLLKVLGNGEARQEAERQGRTRSRRVRARARSKPLAAASS